MDYMYVSIFKCYKAQYEFGTITMTPLNIVVSTSR